MVRSSFIFAVCVVILAPSHPVRGQDSTKLERTEYVLGATAAFSLLDFVGFNATLTNTTGRIGFRILQAAAGAAINYFLYEKFGLSTAISFDLIWWTWGDDLGYYGWTYLINPASPWYNRTTQGLHGQRVTWAGWTPIGLTRPQGSVIDKYVLYAQSVIGLAISIAIE